MDQKPAISPAMSAEEIARLVAGTEPIVVHPGDSLQQLAARAVRNPGCRVLSVVDEGDRLIGIVTVADLLEDLFLKIVPEESLGAIEDVPDALRYAAHIGARTAADIMREPIWVTSQDTLRTIFHRLHPSDISGIPVTDAQLHVIAYVDQLELMMAWIASTGRDILLEPDSGHA